MLMVASASNLRQGNRNLVGTGPWRSCPYGGGAVFFNVETSVIPGTGATECSAATLESIGVMINATLISSGMSSMPDSKFVSGVCDEPISVSTTTTGTTGGDDWIRRRLQTGYIWKGGGACRGCNGDNGDGRKLVQTSSVLAAQQLLYETTFIETSSTIEADVAAAVTQGLASFPCVGTSPQVTVTIDVVKLWQLDLSCGSSSLITQIQWI